MTKRIELTPLEEKDEQARIVSHIARYSMHSNMQTMHNISWLNMH